MVSLNDGCAGEIWVETLAGMGSDGFKRKDQAYLLLRVLGPAASMPLLGCMVVMGAWQRTLGLMLRVSMPWMTSLAETPSDVVLLMASMLL